MKYFIRENGLPSCVDEIETPSYASECLAKCVDQLDEQGNIIEKATWKEITEEEYLSLQPKGVEYKPTYEDLVEQKIRAKYSANQELAINRQRDTKPQEFKEYFDYCEKCKQDAKEEPVKIDYNPVAESVKRTEPVERYF